ncbi:hypothetical protein ILYODFUR_026539 [Ilyodon furcidens]|uniref:Uncharacterized protein n=1 Tax=Ilyodon furcidens TaxID=33524 RepID=A0ABV0SPE3_9TELE
MSMQSILYYWLTALTGRISEVFMHHFNVDSEIVRDHFGGGAGTHVERAGLESESQISEESVERRTLLQMQILHWSGISNAQISFRGIRSVTERRECFSAKMVPNLQ